MLLDYDMVVNNKNSENSKKIFHSSRI